MTIHITHTVRGSTHHLKVDGELCGDTIDTLRETLALWAGRVHLDLSELTRVDGETVDFLIQKIEQGARIESVDPYLELLLKMRRDATSSTKRGPRSGASSD